MAQKYFFITIFFYHFIEILCAKMSRVNEALAQLLIVLKILFIANFCSLSRKNMIFLD